MSFAAKLNTETPQTVWKELEAMGSEIMFTIPFKEEVASMAGFCSVTGNEESEYPILTFCVEKPTGGCVVSTIVFPSIDLYSDFAEKLYSDSVKRFDNGGGVFYE